MAHPKVDVIVYWVDASNGGKVNLSMKAPYYVITEPLKYSPEKISWSLVLEINSNSNKGATRIGLGKAYFLVDDAPSTLLIKGFSLKVYEGPKFVATIEVI